MRRLTILGLALALLYGGVIFSKMEDKREKVKNVAYHAALAKYKPIHTISGSEVYTLENAARIMGVYTADGEPVPCDFKLEYLARINNIQTKGKNGYKILSHDIIKY